MTAVVDTGAEPIDGIMPLLEQARSLAQGLERTLHLVDAPPFAAADVEAIDTRGLKEIAAARSTIEMVATARLAGTGATRPIARALYGAAARGVRVTVLLGPHDLSAPGTSTSLRWFRAAGARVRIAMHAPPLTLLVIDRSLALVRPVDPAEAGLVITGAPAVPALAHLALAYWVRSTVPPQERSPDGDLAKFTAHDRHRLLGLLVSGVKDEAAAREVGVSLRTYRRHVRQLRDELGARSRFEAGFLAGERGWYTSSPAALAVARR
ncbi:hypothetical protein [Georgenia sunbinii]|uniref:hypothetical protein n=1 Tax=Georgenia sunbinii TaxID=3117728 RepID=UPI002F264359